jgi:dienelactone hydrolase
MHRSIALLAIALAIPFHAHAQPAKADKLKPGTWGTIQFQESVPLGSSEQLKLRLSFATYPGEFDVSKETYDILVPKGYRKSEPHGLLIWISAGDNVSLPKDWEKVLDDKKLIVIGARKSGNQRAVPDRMRLAIDANHHLRGLFNVDDRRVYVSGFSGGSRVASMLGVSYADMFTGALCFMGTNFYTATFDAKKEVYPPRYLPNQEILAMAKQDCRYVLVTGEKDFNLANTQAALAGFQQENFKAVELINIPGQGHQPPAAAWLKKSIEFLDGGK